MSFNLFNNCSLSWIFKLSFLQPLNSEKIEFSIPTWYPDKKAFKVKILTNAKSQIVLSFKLYPKKQINIDNIKEAIKTVSPHGIDISTGLKQSNSVDEEKLKKILDNLGFDEIS